MAAFEILGTNLRVKDTILHGESEGKTFYEIIQAGKAFGMITFDDYIIELYAQGLISEETAKAYASNKSVVGRGIDTIKSSRGQATTELASFNLRRIIPDPNQGSRGEDMDEDKTLLSEIIAGTYDAADRPFDFLEENVVTALVCEQDQASREKIISALTSMEYQITTPVMLKEALKNMLFHVYNVVLIDEHYETASSEANEILTYLCSLPMSIRRQIFVVLISDHFRTMDNMAAFNQSVNLIINKKNLDDIGMILNRAVKDNDNFYFVFKETMKNRGRA